eukprot:CAMPEP_0173170620 /NCGR_PEP_ID=MMETSP1141-20130122/1328_1 /TAXON_ID=483371 /ORGANISM="non described non described, Strain CCMP2298" /LENGTH=50 /DNA_ID=CAMNT_0014092513 /DNA_START=2376 /DNA_END=2528 /DNA_ORIENTATION=+
MAALWLLPPYNELNRRAVEALQAQHPGLVEYAGGAHPTVPGAVSGAFPPH